MFLKQLPMGRVMILDIVLGMLEFIRDYIFRINLEIIEEIGMYLITTFPI